MSNNGNITLNLNVLAQVQIRIDPLARTQCRINPARATRPVASVVERVENVDCSEELKQAPSSSESAIREILDKDVDVMNDIQLYSSREMSNTNHLPADQRALITQFLPRNPFAPPSVLVERVVQLPAKLLDNVVSGPHIYPGGNSVGSSVHNVLLEKELLANETGVQIASGDLSILPNSTDGSVISKAYNVLSLGESCLFMNLFPFAGGHSVITLSEAPFVSLKDFTVRQMRDTFCLIIQYIRGCARMAWEGDNYQTADIKGGGEANGCFRLTGSTVSDVSFQQESCDLDNDGKQILWPCVVWNYMPSSAGSIIHPHWQCFVEPQPVTHMLSYSDACEQWTKENFPQYAEQTTPQTYHQALYTLESSLCHTKEEARTKCDSHPTGQFLLRSRGIGLVSVESNAVLNYPSYNALDTVTATCTLDNEPLADGEYVYVFTPFSPRISNEVHLIFITLKNQQICRTTLPVSDISGLSTKQQHALSIAMAAVLKAYHALGVGAANMTVMNGPAVSAVFPEECIEGRIPASVMEQVHTQAPKARYISKHIGQTTDLVIKLNSRPMPSGIYTSDSGPLERMLDTFAINMLPEDFAEALRENWKSYMEQVV